MINGRRRWREAIVTKTMAADSHLVLQVEDENMSTMKSMERKAHQQTLSIRVSDSVREYLERVKEVMSSSPGDRVSTSEAAKMLLESAKDDRLDHRLEAANLRRNTAESLWNIRQTWEQQRGLLHSEWLFLAGYVQVGCEELAEDPERPKAESFAQVPESLVEVCRDNPHRGSEYLVAGNNGHGNWRSLCRPAVVAPLPKYRLPPKTGRKSVSKTRQAGGDNIFMGVSTTFNWAGR
jgi:hypothetical protein